MIFDKAPSAFPDYDLSTMPRHFPAGFVDSSWHNDGCPSVWDKTRGLLIYLDYANDADREHSGGPRFHLIREHDGAVLYGSDEWAAICGLFGAPMRPFLDSLINKPA